MASQTSPASRKTPSKTPSKKTATKKTAPVDAITLLKADHAEVKKLYRRFQKLAALRAPASQRGAVAQAICEALSLHAKVEEEIFYAAARGVLSQLDLLDEAEVEHASAKQLIGQIKRMTPDDALFDAKVIVLCEYVEHHVKEEETELFPKCSRNKALDLYALGQAITQRKAQLLARQQRQSN